MSMRALQIQHTDVNRNYAVPVSQRKGCRMPNGGAKAGIALSVSQLSLTDGWHAKGTLDFCERSCGFCMSPVCFLFLIASFLETRKRLQLRSHHSRGGTILNAKMPLGHEHVQGSGADHLNVELARLAPNSRFKHKGPRRPKSLPFRLGSRKGQKRFEP